MVDMEKLQKNIQILVDLYKKNDLHKAEFLAKSLIEELPKIAILYNIFGLILTNLTKLDDAIINFEKALSLKPKYAEAYNNLGSVYKIKKKYAKSEECYLISMRINNKNSETINNIASLYLILNKNEDAISFFKKAIDINPTFFVAYYNLSIVYLNLGNFNEAKKYLKKTINLNKNFYSAHRALSQIIKYKKNDPHIKQLKLLYNDDLVHINNKAELAFALGKAFEDLKDFSNAYKYFNEGNSIRKKFVNFNIENESNNFKKIKKIFSTTNLFKDPKYKKQLTDNIDKPSSIFIVGMPRSGTTLVEQILSSHSKVFGAGEIDIFSDLVEKYFFDKLKNSYFDNFSENYEIFNKLGLEYMEKINVINKSNKITTDKLPINFKYIGLIKASLPNAKIIHCTRNPKDVCLSIFKNYFSNSHINYGYNIDDLYQFYKLYEDLMIFWKKILPNFIYDVNYEKLVKNPKKEINKMLKENNLDWENQCLKFYLNKRAVRTASETQVRKKMYKSSINSWKKYNPFLKNFFMRFK